MTNQIKQITESLFDKANQILNDEIIIEAKGQYISDFMSDLPHNAYINKGTTGCGGTTLAITNNEQYVIAVHSTNIIINKSKQHSNLCPIYSETTNEDILYYLQNKNILVKKFIVTYDSVPRLLKFIDASEYRLLVDESHILIRYLGHFKTSVCHALIERTYQFKSTSFLTATPTDRSFLPEPLKKLDYVNIKWKNIIKPDIKHMYCGNQIQTKVVSFILDKLDNTDDEIYVFYNSKFGVMTTIKKLLMVRDDITIDDIKIVFADSDENLKFFRQKLKNKKLNIGHEIEVDENGLPVAGYNKRINFISSFGFEGIDFYTHGKDVITLVVADANSKSMRYDISIDMPQILGRFRRDKNTGLFPKNDIFFIWKSMASEVRFGTVEEIFDYIANMIYFGRNTLSNIHSIDNTKAVIDLNKNTLSTLMPYIIVEDITLPIEQSIYIENKYAMEGIMSIYCSTHVDYHVLANLDCIEGCRLSDDSIIKNSLTELSNKLSTFDIAQLDAKSSALLSRNVPFSKIAKEYYEVSLSYNLIETDKLEARNKMQELLEMSDDLNEYLKYVSIETMKIYSFREAKIKELYEVQKLKDVIKNYGIVPGKIIEFDELLDLLTKIYKDNNITTIKPKRTILKDWFVINDFKIINGIRYYEILNEK